MAFNFSSHPTGDSSSLTHGSCSQGNLFGLNLWNSLTVCVVGGGNIAHGCAGWISGTGKCVRVHVLTRQPTRWQKNLIVSANANCKWKDLRPFRANIHTISSDPADVIPEADVVLIALPAQAHLPMLQKIKKFVKEGVIIGSVFGQGGFDWAMTCAFGSSITKVKAFFGLQNVPWLAKSTVYGQSVEIIGPKDFLKCAVVPHDARVFVKLILQLLFSQECQLVPNFLSVTLTPSNQIIHPARYYSIFKGYTGSPMTEGQIEWGLYTQFNAEAGMWLERLDRELQEIRKRLQKLYPQLDLNSVLPLKERIIMQYGKDVKDRTSLQSVIATNAGYAGVRTPATAVPGGFTPALQSRLLYEDVPHGLCVLKGIAEMLKFPTPTIDFMIEWHQKLMGKKYLINGKLNPELIGETSAPARYGIHTLDDLVMPSLLGSTPTPHFSMRTRLHSRPSKL